jgi:DNA uptake protein ComE-like DNA-binding protein
MTRRGNRFTALHGWKDHFTFSRRDRKGIAILSLILFSQCVYLYYLDRYALPPLSGDIASVERQLDEMERSRPPVDTRPQNPFSSYSRSFERASAAVPADLAAFNPNKLDAEGWRRLGLTERQAASVLRYREKGGRFRVKGDIRKVFGIGQERARQILPFVLLPDSLPEQARSRPAHRPERRAAVEVNRADSVQLEALPGIGPGLAGRIVRYRERLGGYHDLDQLREVWGVDDSLFNFIASRLTADSTFGLKRLNLNTDSLPVFGRHPYIGWKIGRVLLNYRKQHGPFQSLEEIRKTGLIAEDIFRKLAPYLEVVVSQ